jgi:hypothetical protein
MKNISLKPYVRPQLTKRDTLVLVSAAPLITLVKSEA